MSTEPTSARRNTEQQEAWQASVLDSLQRSEPSAHEHPPHTSEALPEVFESPHHRAQSSEASNDKNVEPTSAGRGRRRHVEQPQGERRRLRAQQRRDSHKNVLTAEQEHQALHKEITTPTTRHGSPLARRWAGALTRGAKADTYPGELERATKGVQQPITTGRRIAVVSTEGGSGRSTTVALLAQIYSSLRTDRITAADLTGAPSPLGQRLKSTSPVSPQDALGAIMVNNPTTAEGVRAVLNSITPTLWGIWSAAHEEPLQETEVEELLTHTSRHCGITLIECPTVLDDPRTRAALAMAHVVLVVGTATGNGLNHAAQLHKLLADDPDYAQLPTAIVLNNRSSDNPWNLGQLHKALDQRGRIHHSTSYDRHLSTGRDIALDHLDERHRLEWVRLAATALTLARGYGADR